MSGRTDKQNLSERGRGSTDQGSADPGSADPGDDDAVFKALASSTRRRMLDILRQSSCTTGELCAAFDDLDRTTVLQHLRVLEAAELVTGRRVGRERHLTLAPLPIKRISDRWIGEYARAAVELLDTLDRSASAGQAAGAEVVPTDAAPS